MTDNQDFVQNFDESRMITPGQILKSARQAAQLSESDVAKKLHLSMSVILDIENDRYDHFSAFIYIHGYLRAYARLVGVAQEKVLTALDAMELKKELEPVGSVSWAGSAASIPIYTHHGARKNKTLKWISLVVMAVLILLVVMWWHGQQKVNQTVLSKQAGTEQVSNSESTSLPLTANTNSDTPEAVPVTSASNAVNIHPTPEPSSTPEKKQALHPNYLVEPASHK